jgi:polyhydroxyalkanoate synthesis regulator phasin
MAEPAEDRGPLETLSLAGVGAIALVAQRAEELADELGTRLGVERDEVRKAVADVLDSWRREAARIGEESGNLAARVSSELGTASREAVSELELRLAQLEHRVRLLERE